MTIAEQIQETDTRGVAQALLGATLVAYADDHTTGGIIVETEAYTTDDPASHSYGGATRRNASMFLPAGHAYVYRSYGIHWCFNVVTGPVHIGEAVLIRALRPTIGLSTMEIRRSHEGKRKLPEELCSGPGKVCQALGIDGGYDGISIFFAETVQDLEQFDSAIKGIAIVAPETVVPPTNILATRRVGITKGVESFYRFILAGSPWITRSVRNRESVTPINVPGHPWKGN